MSADTDLKDEIARLRVAVQELRAENQKLRARNRRWMRIAGTDSLTGLPNKMFFTTAVLPQQISKSEAEGHPFSCLILAPDQLAEVNQRHGRGGGDAVIRAVGEFLSEQQADGERLVNLDGANFVLLIPDADASAAHKRARIVRARLASRAFPVGEQAMHLTMSMGSVTYSPGAADAGKDVKDVVEQLIGKLTATLDKAKRSGRDRLVDDSGTNF